MCPEMAMLPKCRIAVGSRAFAYTGVDCFGPMGVPNLEGRKTGGEFFAPDHLPSLSAKACVNALTRFVARRGLPQEIRSDNGTDFVAAAKQFRSTDGRRLYWKFNPPGSHFGRAWEGLVGAAKKAMKRVDFTEITEEDELRAALAQAKLLVNTRPMTEYPPEKETRECLTPQHILYIYATGILRKIY